MNNVFCTYSMHGTSFYQVVQAEPGKFYTECIHEELQGFTEAELSQFEADDKLYEAYASTFSDGEFEGCDFYTTEAAAKRVCQIHHELSAISDDISAFNAPSECYALAARPLEKELDQLEVQFGWVSPELRGLPDYAIEEARLRSRPIIEQWNPGTTSFDDIPF